MAEWKLWSLSAVLQWLLLAALVRATLGTNDGDGATPRFEPAMESTTLRIGPFRTDGSAAAVDTMTRPAPGETILVAHWGDFLLVDENDEVIPASVLYQHHMFVYTSVGHRFITGMSNERVTWGPYHLPYPYRFVLDAKDVLKITSFHVVNLSSSRQTYYVKYTVHWHKYDAATLPEPVRPLKYNYWFDQGSFSVTALYPTLAEKGQRSYVRHHTVTMPEDAVMVDVGNHLHQGSYNLTLKRASAPEDEFICVGKAQYGPELCSWDCDKACPYPASEWLAFNWVTKCTVEEPIKKTEALIMSATYDNTCAWNDVMSWIFYGYWDGHSYYPSPPQ